MEFPFGLFLLIIVLLLIGVGLALGVAIALVSFVAVALGIISTSVAVGLVRKRPTAGLRAFFYQTCVFVFGCSGVFLSWLVSTLFELQLPALSILLSGGISGVCVGLLFGALHSWLLDLFQKLLAKAIPAGK